MNEASNTVSVLSFDSKANNEQAKFIQLLGTIRLLAPIPLFTNGRDFVRFIEGKESKGIRNMQIFCFDMTLAVLWAKREIGGPGFLIHDSHLFDGMDSRQVAKAIEIGAEQAEKSGFQYIVCINSDQLEAAEFASGFDPSCYRNPVEITDATDDGGIFGMRIK